MRAQQLVAPFRFEEVVVSAPTAETLGSGEVLLRVIAAGICGSDLPYFKGTPFPLAVLADGRHVNPPGAPLHEVVGEVVASRDPSFRPGVRAVGWASSFSALADYVVTDGAGLFACADPAKPEAAVMLGARHVTGVDIVDRSDVADVFGVDESVHAASARWASEAGLATPPPALIVEAVGHQVGTLRDAVHAVREGGQIYCFGVPDEATYPFPMELFFRKNARLWSGVTPRPARRESLAKAHAYLRVHPGLAERYVTDIFKAADANEAFRLAVSPARGQLKIVLSVT